MKKFLIFIFIFIAGIFMFAQALRAYTLWSTDGECEALFTCYCTNSEKSIFDEYQQQSCDQGT